jgi:hypothetical protein
MKRLILVLFLILSVSGICVAENTATLDPGGYNGAKWGMTREEIKQAIPNVGWKDLTIWNADVEHAAYQDTILEHIANCRFYFNNDKKLNKVVIEVIPKVIRAHSGFFDASLDEKDDVDLFNSILKVLRDKYGEPTDIYRKVSESGISECNWIFPTTQITLNTKMFTYKELSIVSSVNIVYFQRSIKEGNKEDKNKL